MKRFLNTLKNYKNSISISQVLALKMRTSADEFFK